MKNEMYIILTLIPLLAGCGDKKEAARGAMPVPEISVASPVVKDITLTKEYPAYLRNGHRSARCFSFVPTSRQQRNQREDDVHFIFHIWLWFRNYYSVLFISSSQCLVQ